jgi:peptide chain release factor 1
MEDKLKNLLEDLQVDKSKVEREIADLNEDIQTNSSDVNSPEYISKLKAVSKKNRIVEIINKLEKKYKELRESQELKGDTDFAEMAETEIARLKPEIKKLKTELEDLAKKPLPNDHKKAIFEIRPGVGGVEASIFAEDLFKMYSKYCSNKGYPIEIFSIQYNSEGGINEAVFLVNEDESFGQLRFESGVHRVQRVPVTESGGRIHTSSASVVVIPETSQTELKIKPEELKIEVFRASGPGGQSVNTTDSAVRITHIPTKITVSCQSGKSQHKNKEMAMSILASKLQEIEDEKRAKEENKLRENAIKTGDRSEKIRTYNYPQTRITDHRVKQSWHNLDTAITGEIDEIVTSVNLMLRKQINR